MKLDSKEKVLVSIYIEYQKDLPNMSENIKPTILGMEKEIFNVSILKLSNEGLITGANIQRGGMGNKILFLSTQNIMMTRAGIEYVEEKIGLSNVLTGEEKIKHILKDLASSGLNQLKDIAAKTLSEMSKP